MMPLLLDLYPEAKLPSLFLTVTRRLKHLDFGLGPIQVLASAMKVQLYDDGFLEVDTPGRGCVVVKEPHVNVHEDVYFVNTGVQPVKEILHKLYHSLYNSESG